MCLTTNINLMKENSLCPILKTMHGSFNNISYRNPRSLHKINLQVNHLRNNTIYNRDKTNQATSLYKNKILHSKSLNNLLRFPNNQYYGIDTSYNLLNVRTFTNVNQSHSKKQINKVLKPSLNRYKMLITASMFRSIKSKENFCIKKDTVRRKYCSKLFLFNR